MKSSERLAKLNDFFFRENGFHGARFDYENRANSHLNEVLDDREGLPITLCILYREVGRGGGLDIAGVSRPGQFVVRVTPPKDEGPPVLIDVFEGGSVLDEPATASLPPAPNREIILRMLQNLKVFSVNREKPSEALVYANVIVALSPDDAQQRLSRAWLSAWNREWDVVRRDVDWLKGKDLGEPGSAFLDRIIQQLEREEARK